MIKARKLIALFERMYAEDWQYEWGAAQEYKVDCSGAFVYAYKQLGGGAIEHGSNSIARKRCGKMYPMSQAQPGWACFKWREKDTDKFPDGKGDFYHIGLYCYDGRVLNAQGEKNDFEHDLPGSWQFCAPLLAVDYSENEVSVTVHAAYICQLQQLPDFLPPGFFFRGTSFLCHIIQTSNAVFLFYTTLEVYTICGTVSIKHLVANAYNATVLARGFKMIEWSDIVVHFGSV